MLTLVEHPAFTKQALELFEAEEFRRFQVDLVARPDAGDVIPGLGGIRKIRWGAGGKGKRGGARVIYLWIPEAGTIYLFQAYTKGDITDLSAEQKRRLREAVEQIKRHFQP